MKPLSEYKTYSLEHKTWQKSIGKLWFFASLSEQIKDGGRLRGSSK